MSSTTGSIIPEYRGALPRVSPLRGAIIQTGAVFVDAYRELNARKMFWGVLIISGIIVIAFAGVGLKDEGVSIFGINLPLGYSTRWITRGEFYKLMFNMFGLHIWLSGWASALALISTAGIFPDLLTGGSIDLYLSKPMSRLRLFVTKYIAALLFVTLQVSVFTIASFCVIGIRGGAWLWGLLLAIPITVCFFSYLYSLCVLFGMITRSTLATLLLTLLCWFGVYIIHQTEASLLFFKFRSDQQAVMVDRKISNLQQTIARLETPVTTRPTTLQFDKDESWWSRVAKSMQQSKDRDTGENGALAQAKVQLEQARKEKSEHTNPFNYWHRVSLIAISVLPKTSETIEVLDRSLAKYANIQSLDADDPDMPPPNSNGRVRRGGGNSDDDDGGVEEFQIDRHAKREAQQAILHRSFGWVIGTSLAFEAAMLGLATLIFVRRDF